MHAISQKTQNQEFCSTYPKLAVSEKIVVDFTKNTAYNICLFWFHDFDFLQFRRNNTCREKRESLKEECQISHCLPNVWGNLHPSLNTKFLC